MTVLVDVKGKRTRGEVVKENKNTVLVKLPDGKLIKRHRAKHNLQECLSSDSANNSKSSTA